MRLSYRNDENDQVQIGIVNEHEITPSVLLVSGLKEIGPHGQEARADDETTQSENTNDSGTTLFAFGSHARKDQIQQCTTDQQDACDQDIPLEFVYGLCGRQSQIIVLLSHQGAFNRVFEFDELIEILPCCGSGSGHGILQFFNFIFQFFETIEIGVRS